MFVKNIPSSLDTIGMGLVNILDFLRISRCQYQYDCKEWIICKDGDKDDENAISISSAF